MKTKIKKLLNENVVELEGIGINDDMPLILSGYLDSFEIINFIGILEEEFKITIPIDNIHLEDFDTVSSIEILLKKILGNAV